MVKIEEELSAIGENQKQLEISEEKARRREEKYQVLLPYIPSQKNPLIILKEVSATDTLHLLSAGFILNSWCSGPDQAAEHQAEGVRFPLRVRWDEHHQAPP